MLKADISFNQEYYCLDKDDALIDLGQIKLSYSFEFRAVFLFTLAIDKWKAEWAINR